MLFAENYNGDKNKFKGADNTLWVDLSAPQHYKRTTPAKQ
jgi:hypothetical protein